MDKVSSWQKAEWDIEAEEVEDLKKLEKMNAKSRVRLHNAFITISEIDVDYLSYKGQEAWNKLAEMEGKKK